MDSLINGMKTKAILSKTEMGIKSGLRGRTAAAMDKNQLMNAQMVKK